MCLAVVGDAQSATYRVKETPRISEPWEVLVVRLEGVDLAGTVHVAGVLGLAQVPLLSPRHLDLWENTQAST